MKETSTHIYFWGSIYSQWAKTSFLDKNKQVFYTAEQYMMYQKALLFNDTQTAQEILKTKDPKVQKALGRKVKGFSEELWNKNKYRIVVQGNLYKFEQNDKLKKELLATGSKTLVEGSPYDKIWGVGLKYDDPKILNSDNWQGENLLGKALMKVRDILNSSNARDMFYQEFGDEWEL
jgi:ribA/ribD-fused uncharacterized protein